MPDTEEQGLTLEEWLDSTQQRREQLEAFCRTKMPIGISSSEEMDEVIQATDDAGRLLADADGYLILETARSIFEVKKKHGDLAADERKQIVKDKVREVKRLVDGLSVTHTTLKSRLFAIMNHNKSR